MVAYNGYGDPGAIAVQPKNIARMPVLKEVTSSSTVSWCPLESHKDLLAAGTVSGTIDDSFQTSSRLMILNTSLSDGSPEMPVLGQARVKDADFVRISWGAKGHSDSSMPLGLIAGGMSDGSVLLWNADSILKGTARTPIAAKRHGSHVSGLAFHPTEQNLIASGSADSELLIWDLKNVSSPTASPPGSSVNTEKSSIIDIAWNLKVPHILACSSSNGQTSVWDLRQKRAVITFTESTHRHIPATALAWDPTQARQLVVSYAYPAAEVWDLRYGMAPKQVLQGGHSRGSILTVAWSQYDSNVILTTGEDATSCIWNAQDGTLLDCIQDRGTIFCLKWHPFNAELLAGSTYEGNVTVRSISNTGNHVPEWKGRPCGGLFGFGSRLVTFGNGYAPGSIRCFKVSTEPEFVRMASEFQSDISQIDMKTFCSQKIAKSQEDPEERSTWEFLRLLFESDSRNRFLSHLGFPPRHPQKPSLSDPSNVGTAKVERIDDVSDEDFFNQLSPERIDSKPGADAFNGLFSSANPTAVPAKPGQSEQEESEDEASDLDKEINSLLIVGDIERAANLCVKNKRMADALTIASLGTAELQIQVQQLYMGTHKKHYIGSIASSIASRDIPCYVKRSDVSRWKETLALIITYCPPEQHIPTVRILVDRLDAASMNQAAIICCLCCGDVDGAALQWQKQEHQCSGKSRIDALQASVEKLYVMSQACGQTTGQSASGLYSEYAGLLSAQGAMAMALSFLQIAGSSTDELAFRIYYSGVSPQSMPAPPQPFYVKNVSSHNTQAAPGRLSNVPGGSRRGPIPSQSSFDDKKPSSVPPQNRMASSSAAPPAMGAPRGHPPAPMRPPYKPIPGAGVVPGPRPNSVPPQENAGASRSSLPSRHLLNDSAQQAPHGSQFPGSGYNPQNPAPAGRPPFQDAPTRTGFMPPSRPGAGLPGRPGQGYPPPSGRGPMMGHPSPTQTVPGRRPVPTPGLDRSVPSPSMSPAPRPSPSPGRYGAPSRPPPAMAPSQRSGPSPSRVSQPPMQSASGIRQPPSPLRSARMSSSFPGGQMPRPMPGRPGSSTGTNDYMPLPNTAAPSMTPVRPGLGGPVGRQPSPGPGRFPPPPVNTTNGPAGSYQGSPATGPVPSRPVPNRPGMGAPNPPMGMGAGTSPMGQIQGHPHPSRPTPMRPGMSAPDSAFGPSQPRQGPPMQHAPMPGQQPPPGPFRPQAATPQQAPAPFRPGMNAPERGPNPAQPPFRPGMNSAPIPNMPMHPHGHPQHPAAQHTAHGTIPPSQSMPPNLQPPMPNPGRPVPGPASHHPPGPFRPGMNPVHAPSNQPSHFPNPASHPPNQPQGSFGAVDAVNPRQGPVPFRSVPGRPGFSQAPRPQPTPDLSAYPHQRQQSPYAPINGPAYHAQPGPSQQPIHNQLHQSASQPILHQSDPFDQGLSTSPAPASFDADTTDFFSDAFEQRASAPAIPAAANNPVQNATVQKPHQHPVQDPSGKQQHSPSPKHSPSAPTRSPNQGRSSPNLSFANQRSPDRHIPNRTDNLVAIFQSCFADLHELCQDVTEKAVIDNARVKFESEVYNRISSGSFSANTMKSLESLAKALQSHNKSGVQQANIALITDSWAEVKTILPVIKSIVEVCKKIFN